MGAAYAGGSLHPEEPVSLTGDRYMKFASPVVRVAFLCTNLDEEGFQAAFDPHRKTLESFGFPLPSSPWTMYLETTMTELGIERTRFAELLRDGQDTRALVALFWWTTPISGDYRQAAITAVNVIDVDSADAPLAIADGRLDDADDEEQNQDLADGVLGEPLGYPGSDAAGQPDPTVLFGFFMQGHEIKVNVEDLHRVQHITQIPFSDLKVAAKNIADYRWDRGLLQRHIYNSQTGLHEWYSVVPEGGWKAVQHQGKTRRLDLRKYVIMLAHHSAVGGHRSRDKTVDSIADSGLWWSSLKTDVDNFIRACLVCRYAKGKTLVTGGMRSREAEGPFRVLMIDFVGPQHPVTSRGNLYLFTCICIFSGWFWAIPTKGSDSKDAAQAFVERIMLDLAGVPVIICSDRARAFIEGVLSHVESTFGISSILGSALHPQSQGAVERPHRVYKALCIEFMKEFGEQWDAIAPHFVWVVRTTSKVYNGRYTPYEIITGMKPRLPLDAVLSTPSVVAKRSADEYVSDLVEYMQSVHKFVQEEHRRIRERERDTDIRKRDMDRFRIGDYVFLKRPGLKPEPGHSRRFNSETDARLFQIIHAPSTLEEAKTVTLMDPATGKTQFEFAQPVSTDLLIPVEVLPVSRHISERTRIRCGHRSGTIQATCVDGRVHVQWDDTADLAAEVEVLDLSTIPHEFIVDEQAEFGSLE